MIDVLSEGQRSFCMSRIRGSDTKPEITLRRVLWRYGLRYRVKNHLPGKPDIVFASSKVAVFVDGCFWHRCPSHYVKPKTRNEFWEKKIRRNVERDDAVNSQLRDLGWKVLRFWEHEIQEDVDACAKRVVNAVRGNRKLD